MSATDQAKIGTACTSTTTNSCGDTNPNAGVYTCDSTGRVSCSADLFSPPERSGYGTSCTLTSVANACGQTTTSTTGTIGCSGACTGTAPAAPSVTTPTGMTYGSSCTLTSTPNSCGMTTVAAGTYNCQGVCASTAPTAPSNAFCAAPSAPTLSGPYMAGQYGAPANPAYAYSANGYQIFAKATSPYAGDNLTYYFEYSTDGVTWTRGDWSSGLIRP